MPKLISYCGLDCGECEAYLASQADDQVALAKVAEKWTKEFGAKELTAEMCVCDGCASGRRLNTAHAATCGLRLCASSRSVPTCAHCDDYMCETLRQFVQFAPVLGEKLEKLRLEIGK
jgi:hypothetical protein